jgi:hypothetical protein
MIYRSKNNCCNCKITVILQLQQFVKHNLYNEIDFKNFEGIAYW